MWRIRQGRTSHYLTLGKSFSKVQAVLRPVAIQSSKTHFPSSMNYSAFSVEACSCLKRDLVFGAR